MHRKYVSWRNILRSEPLFPPLLYFQSKVTSVHVPQAWDARETRSIGGAPQWKNPVSQLHPEARSLGEMGAISSPVARKAVSRPAARRDRD